ncbi:hypothetical protein DAEQUDRAFT_683093 [Daedalea quercina L-15889]|uniref:HNH domain-containing protein n=1 Tax=Daedalea quercina L-15889 TaxID=1314783 RepID=A0A165U0M7_9APHY|nr:hypothetical protein DAEQUDRAFT_683093 [Daedalea quercina L-15889]
MPEESAQYVVFNQCLARRVLSQPGIMDESPEDNASLLDDFTSYLASEVWPVLPSDLRSATYEKRAETPDVDLLKLENIPPSFVDTLISCGIAGDADDAVTFLRKIILEYAAEATSPPPVWSKTRTLECEICERSVPLTYHHLIPREVHAKALKKKWHPEVMLNSVAWLCRPCHSTVHQVASNEQLATEYYTIDRLLGREDIQKWRKYISKQRWGIKRG